MVIIFNNKRINLSIILLLAVVIVSVSLSFGSVKGLASAKIDELMASGHPEYPPFMWRENGEIVGVGPTLLEMVLSELGIKSSFDYVGTWDEAQNRAKNGEIDMLVAIYDSEERKQYLDYTVSFGVDPVVIFVLAGNEFNFSVWSDLTDKKGVTTIGESFGTDFDRYIEENLDMVKFSTVEECLAVLQNGDAEYFVYALYSGKLESQRLGYTIINLENPVTVENWYMGISKKSSFVDKIDDINKEISKIVESGLVEELILEYTAKFLADF